MSYRIPPGKWDIVLQMDRGSYFYFQLETRRYAVASPGGSLTTGNLSLEIDQVLPRLPESFDLADFMALVERELDPQKRAKVRGWESDPEAFSRFKNYLGRQLYYLRYLGLIRQTNERGAIWSYRKLGTEPKKPAKENTPEGQAISPRRYITTRLEELEREEARIQVEKAVLRLALAHLE